MPAKGVVDALTNTYSDVAKMKLLPDSQQHMEFLDGLQQGLMQYIQISANATLNMPGGAQAGMGGPGGGIGAGVGSGAAAGGPPPGAGMGGPGPGPGPQPMQIAPGGGGGMSGLMSQPNSDDLRRLLSTGPQGSPG
jgi:hypothetical protein